MRKLLLSLLFLVWFLDFDASGAFAQPVFPQGVSQGYIPGKLIATGTTQDATIVKAAPGILGYFTATNINAAPMFVKFYNKATAPTSSDTPVHTFLIPGGTAGAGTNIPFPEQGVKFTAGISFRIVTTVPDNGNTGVTAAEVVVNYGYK